MLKEDLEFRISQYIDGTLDDTQRRALERELEQDSNAAQLLGQYRQIDNYLKSALPLPQVDYDALANRISDAIDQADRPHVLYSFKWVRRAASIAVAACIILAAGIWIYTNGLIPSNGNNSVIVQVTGPQSEAAFADPIQVIQIGPSAVAAAGPSPASEVLVAKPSRLVIASAADPEQDTVLPY